VSEIACISEVRGNENPKSPDALAPLERYKT